MWTFVLFVLIGTDFYLFVLIFYYKVIQPLCLELIAHTRMEAIDTATLLVHCVRVRVPLARGLAVAQSYRVFRVPPRSRSHRASAIDRSCV